MIENKAMIIFIATIRHSCLEEGSGKRDAFLTKTRQKSGSMNNITELFQTVN